MKAIDLYVVPPSPPCRAVIIAVKYMKIDVNLIYVNLMKGEQKQDWFVKLNPQHCLPTIDDNGFILWESRAIMTYFANRYAPNNQIYPTDPKKRAIVDRLLQFDLNVLYRSLGDFLIPIVREGKKLSNLNPVKERKVIEALTYLDSLLANNQYVVGEHITLADFSIYFSLEFADQFRYNFCKYNNICAWFQRLQKEIKQINQMMDHVHLVIGAHQYSRTKLHCLNDVDKCQDQTEDSDSGKCESQMCQSYGNCVSGLSTNDLDLSVHHHQGSTNRQNLFNLLKATNGKLYDTTDSEQNGALNFDSHSGNCN